MQKNVIARLMVLSLSVSFVLDFCTQTRVQAETIAPEVASINNLIGNGDFESGGALPAVWNRYPPKDQNGNRQLRDVKVFHSGKASGLIWSVTPHPKGKAGMQWNQYGIHVEGGSALIVSMYVKSEGARPAGGGIHFYDEKRQHLGFVRIPGPETADNWAYIRQEVNVPKAAKTMGFAAYAADEGKTWYDDVAVIGAPTTSAIRATPKLDGKLDDACWTEDRAITAFVEHTGAKLPTEKVRAWLAYNDSNLYVAFLCPHPKGARLRQKATQRDGRTWLDDSIEVFLDPEHHHDDYYQFCVNSLGVIRDSHRTDTAWDSGARAEVARGETAWTVELAIPFDNLGIDLNVGAIWGINLARNDRVHGETVTWSIGGFHKPERFGNVGLAPDLGRFYQADLATKVEDRDRERQLLLKEMDAVDLSEDAATEALSLMGKAKATTDNLRKIAHGEAALPDGGWDGVRHSLTDISETLTAARNAAVNSIFKMGGSGANGFRVAIAHSLQKIRRSGPITGGRIARSVRLEAARDETESFQLVVIPDGQELKGVGVEAKALEGPGSAIQIVWNRVGYVETAQPGYRTEYVGWWPDPLLPPASFDVSANERQPLWFTISVPPSATPGQYSGEVTIRHGDHSISVPVELRVRNFRLPRPGTLATAFGLYRSFLAKWWYGNEASKMPIEVYARWCKFLGKYRLTPKNIAREYVSQTSEGKQLRVDMSALQQTVGALASSYFAPYSFCLFRLPVSSKIGKSSGATSATDPNVAASVVKAYADEWKRQGLPPKVYIYGYDEPSRSHYPFLREAYARIREVAPDFPIMQTIGDPNPRELVGLVDIWCPLTSRLSSSFYAKRRDAGDTLWTYVCCSPKPPYANFFVDRPAVDHRVVFWQTYKAGATGFLYWCVCIWDGLPMAVSGEKCFPDAAIHLKDHVTYKAFKVNGDGIIVYPGENMTPLSSIRLEVIRDGIEDYEYLAMLSRLIEKTKALPLAKRPAPDLIQKAEELCIVPATISRTFADYTKEPARIFERRREVGDILERLTQMLAANPQ